MESYVLFFTWMGTGQLTFNIYSKQDGMQAPRSLAPFGVLMPLRGLQKRITLAFQRCANLEAQTLWTGLA